MTREEALKKMQEVKAYMTAGNPIWSVTVIGEAFDMAIEALEAEERKTGEWIPQLDKWGDIVTTVEGYKCSECNSWNTDKDNFCPNCGAEMLKGEEE